MSLDAFTRSDPSEFRDQVLEYLRERRERGNSYVTSSMIANEFDTMPQKAGKNLSILSDQDYLEIWNNGSNGRTYRITDAVLEEADADV